MSESQRTWHYGECTCHYINYTIMHNTSERRAQRTWSVSIPHAIIYIIQLYINTLIQYTNERRAHQTQYTSIAISTGIIICIIQKYATHQRVGAQCPWRWDEYTCTRILHTIIECECAGGLARQQWLTWHRVDHAYNNTLYERPTCAANLALQHARMQLYTLQ